MSRKEMAQLEAAAALLSAKTITLKEAREMLGISHTSIYFRVNRAKILRLPTVKVGAFRRVPIMAIEEMREREATYRG